MSSSASTPGSGERVALDTSVAIDVLAATADARLLTSVSDHLLPAPVVGELRYGALNSRKALENLAKVDALVTRCVVLNVTVATAEVYARPRLALRQKGKPIRRTTSGSRRCASSTRCRLRPPTRTSMPSTICSDGPPLPAAPSPTCRS